MEARKLCISYRAQSALTDVDLAIPNGEITAIVGPSGCGKSSFLSALNRLSDLVPGCRVEGTVLLDGRDVLQPDCDLHGLRKRVGMVFQKPNPFPLSIRRNMTLPLKEHRVPKARIEPLAQEALQEVGLWEEVKDRLEAPAQSLSGGQQQRLCIARALALQPEVILFDEPCSALDPLASSVVEELIHSLRGRVTVVIVTHNLAQAARIADHLAVFWLQKGSGTLLEAGPARQVFESPTHPLVADYLAGARG